MGDLVDPEGGEIFEEPFDEALSKRYLAYALSTITQRALPDARDGLKPVHRRILHAMRVLKLNPRDAFKKSARVVGDVIGKFHPHGDQAVYDALVRLAQDFASRYPLVEGQGNFGNIDGDGAAAMRYTEARLTEAAELLLQDIDQGTVDFRETYDGSEEEPVVLPAAFPNLLANGATGIAVGMATSIPPHNAYELCRAARTLIANPEASVAQLLRSVKGPDFPTGGICVEPPASIREAYETGRGGFRLRARWETEDLGRGTWQIVVTEIPYQVQKSKLVERVAQLLDQKKLPLLEDVRDESAEDIRLVLVPKSKNVDPELLMAALFKMSDLETRISLNLNVLDPSGTPRVMSLKDVMRIWLDHRREVVVRRAQTRLAKVEDRLEVLAGYIIVYADLDEVIRIIRFEDEPKAELMKRFDLSDRQAEAILNMRLRALRKLEELEIRKEEKSLKGERSELKTLIGSEEVQWAKVDEEIAGVEESFGPKTDIGRRRTDFGEAGEDISDAVAEALIVKESILVVVSQKGWIRALKGHAHDIAGIAFKEGDSALFTVKCETIDKLILFGTDGKFYAIDASKLPGGRGHGDPLRIHAGLPEDAAPLALFKHDPERELLIASEAGNGFRVKEADVFATKKGGKQALNVGDGEAIACVPVIGSKIAVSNSKKRLLIFDVEDLPQMSRGKGVRLMGGKGAELIDVATFDPEEGLIWIDGAGRRHVFTEWAEWEGKRAQAGSARPRGFPKTGKFMPADPVAVARAMDSA
ncbi:DNA topoisomerase IV subunit A [Hyphobacterium sp. HN65]|uniref:DNA topoisomerase 4 subunit A n=1 Tax=Hyphobacterium lacteum TaxID=3116575 RepID=A0ABU7LMA2_9PROT|nr:DNA topoisomerase IV subunit A [Hyphobacterium sp. HN65]MEE2525051.1 DNA topoisomerase IV subunit A [Hyphobacterium sp. HN65]